MPSRAELLHAMPPNHSAMSLKRKAAADATEENKKLRSTIDSLADEYLCPITQELPVDPVTAEDGRVYERSAIEAWLGRERPEGQLAKSPVTNEPMGPRLFPAVQVRNSIKGMVQSGALSGSKADAWKQRLAEEEEVAEMRRRAEAGDGSAAEMLGNWYLLGHKGLPKDKAQSFQWTKRGADLGHATAMSNCGLCYADGEGVAQNFSRAIFYMRSAAALGSENACYDLGDAFVHGRYALDKDEAEARRWFRKMPGCLVKDCEDAFRVWAREWLRQH
jgi:TPR repeat protein